MIKIKKCTGCERALPETPEFFYREKKGKNGLRAICKMCASQYDKIKGMTEEQRKKKNKSQKQYYKKRREHFISISYIHKRLRKQHKKPKYCTICNQDKRLELSSINHTYSENIEDWVWVCHECHALFDIEQRGVIIGH